MRSPIQRRTTCGASPGTAGASTLKALYSAAQRCPPFVGQPWAVLHNPLRGSQECPRTIQMGRSSRRSPYLHLHLSPSPRLIDYSRVNGALRAHGARRALTLFEVIVALAIFMGAVCAIGQLLSSGVRSAVQARLLAQGVLRAETKMAEIAAGIVPMRAGGGSFPDDSSWTWSATTASGPHQELYIVEVTVSHPSATRAGNVSYSLRRFVRDPNVAIAAYEKQQEQQQTQQQQQQQQQQQSSGSK